MAMTHGEIIALVGGGAIFVAGGVALWYFSRPSSATTTTTLSATTLPSTTVATSSSTTPTALPCAASAQQIAQWKAQVVASGIAPFYLTHAPVGATFNGQQFIAAQYAADGLLRCGITTIPGYMGAPVIGVVNGSATSGSGGSSCRQYYTVQSGNNLSEIAYRFGVSLGALKAANPQISNPNLIYPGQQLCIPA